MLQHVDIGFGLVIGRLGDETARQQILGALQRVIGVAELQFERAELAVERLRLQGELLVRDDRDDVPRLDLRAFVHRAADERAANARARRGDVAALDLAEHGLHVRNLARLDGEVARLRGARKQKAQSGGGALDTGQQDTRMAHETA